MVFIDIEHTVYSATGIYWLHCNYKYALCNVPKCSIVAVFLFTKLIPSSMHADGYVIHYADATLPSNNPASQSGFVRFLESASTIHNAQGNGV